MSGYDSSILVPDQLNESSVTTMFQKLAEEMYASFKGTLKCGNLESKIVLSPAPVVSVFNKCSIFVIHLSHYVCCVFGITYFIMHDKMSLEWNPSCFCDVSSLISQAAFK